MLDSKLRPIIDPPLNAIGKKIAGAGVSADMVTFIGFGFGLCAFAALAFQFYLAALLFIGLSRLMDGLDGPVARHSSQGPSDLGAFYDIVSDFVFYSGTVFFFAAGRPEHALAAAFLIFSFMGSASSFLTYAVIATKKNLNHNKQGKKSFYYLAGLCEGTETIFAFTLFCLFPDYFVPLAIIFGILCWVTTAGRILQARKDFAE